MKDNVFSMYFGKRPPPPAVGTGIRRRAAIYILKSPQPDDLNKFGEMNSMLN